jgi:hypothetical protein
MKAWPAAQAATLLFAFLAAPLAPDLRQSILPFSAAMAQEDWEKEFQAVCSKTDDAMALTVQELRTLVGRCDELKTSIDKLEGSRRKVLLKRLQMCRDLYAFTLDTRERE